MLPPEHLGVFRSQVEKFWLEVCLNGVMEKSAKKVLNEELDIQSEEAVSDAGEELLSALDGINEEGNRMS